MDLILLFLMQLNWDNFHQRKQAYTAVKQFSWMDIRFIPKTGTFSNVYSVVCRVDVEWDDISFRSEI